MRKSKPQAGFCTLNFIVHYPTFCQRSNSDQALTGGVSDFVVKYLTLITEYAAQRIRLK